MYTRPLKEVFADALELPEEQRPGFLDRECGQGGRDRVRIEQLLRVHAAGQGFMSGTSDNGNSAAAGEVVGDHIGQYRLLERIGEGGFGDVFLAEQTEPIVRHVAIKVLKDGMSTRQVIARFEAERQALARMDHPNIATVFEAGATGSGRPYFAMELVRGEMITSYCECADLDTRSRLELFEQVCGAVQHAHQKGVIHRDLKPTNVLVTEVDGRPVPKVIDFGAAKSNGLGLVERPKTTLAGTLIGTPEYMSPEQAGSSGTDVDTRSDIYSLGVLLYELLTRSTPFAGFASRDLTFDELMRRIREAEPEKPSTRLAAITKHADASPQQRMELDRLKSRVRGDLDCIVMKCLEKDRTRRYESASDLALDVRRHLRGEPVLAAPPSASYRLRKFVRRHRLGVTAGSAILLLLVLGGIGTAIGLASALRERDRAERTTRFMRETLRGVEPAVAAGRDTSLLRELMDGAAARITSGELRDAPEVELALRVTIGETYCRIAAFDRAASMLGDVEDLARSIGGGEESVLLWEALEARASLFEGSGDWPQSLSCSRRALAVAEHLFGGDSVCVPISLSNVARLLIKLGRPAEAAPLFQHSMEMNERLLSPGDPILVSQQGNLGALLHSLGRPQEAEPVLRRALEAARRAHSGDHPMIEDALFNLGSVLLTLQRADEAGPLLQDSLDMSRRLRPAGSAVSVEALRYCAAASKARGRLREAVDLLREAVSLCHLLPDGDGHLVLCVREMAQLVDLLFAAGRSAEAVEPLRDQLALERSRPEPDESQLSRTLQLLALALLNGDTAEGASEAELLLRECMAIRQRLYPEGDARHWLVFNATSALGQSIVTLARHGVGSQDQRLERLREAESLLLESQRHLASDPSVPAPDPLGDRRRDAIDRLVQLYETWESADPGHEHGQQAAHWRTLLGSKR